jgi:hypothetical protein
MTDRLEVFVSRSRKFGVALGEGAAFHIVFTAASFGTLLLWARHIEARRLAHAPRPAA